MKDQQPEKRWEASITQNRRAWEEIADARAASYPDSKVPAEFFQEGGSILDDRVVDAIGDVRGLRLLHLMCSTGEETLSWASLGAHVVGVDFSPSSIAAAEDKARGAQVGAEFIEADVGRLPEKLTLNSFDLVYTATGVMVWIPDLDTWAKAITSALRPGGRFILWEEHPLWYTLSMEEGHIRVVGDYFRREKPVVSTGWDHFADGDKAVEEKQEFLWPLGDIVNALGAQGIPVEQLNEYPAESEWRLGHDHEDAKKLPGLVLLVARKM
jgi:ubiquinone/menaquinone biosynthesis C-methylase UbiE